jgi:hypothetical protein
MRELTTAAKAAKLIRTELKKTFPEAKFRVRSNNYAGGDSVYVNWTDGPTSEQVSDITAKYQYGHFDGMIDLYEYSNRIEGLPQVKFVLRQREISDETYARKKTALAKEFGIKDETNEEQWFSVFHYCSDQVTRRELYNEPL